MNLVGKILTLLIFVMSIVFMTMAVMLYQARNNWRDDILREKSEVGKPKGWKYRLQDAEEQNRELRSQLTEIDKRLKAEKSAHQRTIAALQTDSQKWDNDRKTNNQEIASLRQDNAEKTAAIEVAHKSLNHTQDERDTYKKDIEDARKKRDASFDRSTKLADRVHQLAIDLKRVLARNEDLIQDNQRMRDIMRSNHLDPDTNPLTILPDVKGIVVAMPEKGHMEVSLGSDDGLLPGHYLEVYRVGSGTSTYLGRIEVVRTEPDRAVCRILPEYRKGRMQTGDRVASKLE